MPPAGAGAHLGIITLFMRKSNTSFPGLARRRARGLSVSRARHFAPSPGPAPTGPQPARLALSPTCLRHDGIARSRARLSGAGDIQVLSNEMTIPIFDDSTNDRAVGPPGFGRQAFRPTAYAGQSSRPLRQVSKYGLRYVLHVGSCGPWSPCMPRSASRPIRRRAALDLTLKG